MYSKIKSKLVRKELKKTAWNDMEYIARLMDIEKFALGTYVSSGYGYIYNLLNDSYSQQWKAIWMELNPVRYKDILLREKKLKVKERKEQIKFIIEENKMIQQDRKEWKMINKSLR